MKIFESLLRAVCRRGQDQVLQTGYKLKKYFLKGFIIFSFPFSPPSTFEYADSSICGRFQYKFNLLFTR